MATDALGKALVERVRNQPDLNWTILEQFVGVKTAAIERWLRKPSTVSKKGNLNGPPKGERLNRLFHFLYAIGVHCPEMEKLSPYVRYVGELHAYGIVVLVAEKDYPEYTIANLLGVKNSQTVFNILRGDQRPIIETAPKEVDDDKDHFDLPIVKALYDKELNEKKEEWKSLFAQALTGKESGRHTLLEQPAGPVIQPAPVSPAPVVEAEDPTPQVLKPEVSLPAVIESPQVVEQPQPESRPAKPASTADNTDRMLRLAEKLSSVIPVMEYAASDMCSDADRALMRQLLGQDNMHTLRMLLQKLTSSRSMREGS